MIKAVIFDMDGVLVKTLHIATMVAQEVLGKHGIELSDEDIAQLAGSSWKDFLAYIFKTRRLSLIDDLHDTVVNRYTNLLPDYVLPYEQATDTLVKLRHLNLQLAVASGSSLNNIQRNLERCHLFHFFSVVVSAEQVLRGKPKPDVYLKAIELLKLQSNECMAVEDTPIGITAVQKAGMHCIGITHTCSRDQLAQADVVIDALSEIPLLLV